MEKFTAHQCQNQAIKEETKRWVKLSSIELLTTETLGQIQKTVATAHPLLLRHWVERIYGVHGYNISADRGGHFRDIEALADADTLLDGPIRKALEKLVPFSSVAQALKETKSPLSASIYHLKMDR